MTHTGRPLPNAALLGSFAALSWQISFDAVAKAIREKFPGKVGESNVAAALAAFNSVMTTKKFPAEAMHA
jgi:pyruvate ferredoxin oxidoreductase gamma subunit